MSSAEYRDRRFTRNLPDAYLDGVAAILARGRELDEFQFDESPRDKALFVLASLHGAVLKFRSMAPGSFETIRVQLLATLG